MTRLASRAWDGLSETVLDWLGMGEGQPGDGRQHGWVPAHPLARLLALVAFVLAVLTGWWWLERGPDVKVVAVRSGDAAEVVYATGIVEPVYWAKVTSLQRKRIVDICKCEGEAVAKGDVLVRLDDEQERATLTELESRLTRLKEDAARLEGLVKRSIASRVSLDDKMTEVAEHEARVLFQKNRVSELELKAPLDGVVLRRTGEVGEIAGIGATDTLLWVGQPKPLKIIADVNEDDILKVAPGQPVLLRHEGQVGAPLKATVERITPKGDPETKTFRVHLLLPEDSPLKIGMSVEANIVVREAKNALLVPAEALTDGSIWKVQDGRLSRVAVETGIRGTSEVEIRGDVAAGDLVVSPVVAGLSDGGTVRAVPATAAGPGS